MFCRGSPVGPRRGGDSDNKIDLREMEIGLLWDRFVSSSWLLAVLKGLVL